MTINAFHPAYVQTYMPEFLSTIRSESAAKLNGQKFGAKGRATRENASEKEHSAITMFPKTKARVSLEPTDFYVYSRAGMPKEKK